VFIIDQQNQKTVTRTCTFNNRVQKERNIMNGLNGGSDLPPVQDDSIVAEQALIESINTPADDLNKEDAKCELNLNENEIKSSVLIISNLARPFTNTGLKKVLSKCGKILDDKFWLNKDKTLCCVCYENEEIADESRVYINNLKWPASNPNTLLAKFSSVVELDELIKKDEEEKLKLENERKEAVRLEAIRQEEREQQLKEELTKRFNESLNNNVTAVSHVTIEQQNEEDSMSKSNNNEKSSEEQVRAVSPARNAESNVIHISNLQRGFTMKQFKELLCKYGKLIDEKLWLDRLKSNCYAVYESNEEAINARKHLHGMKWPKTNSKLLRVDFGKLADVNILLNGNAKSKEENVTVNNSLDKSKEQVKDDHANQEEASNELSNNITNQKEESKENLNKTTIGKELSPAKNSISTIVYVRNLSRPFTRQQLSELLSMDGSYDKERFWIDKVKSQCYVAYENEEVASKTRDRLHRLTWPSGNHRRLIADFATEAELDEKLSIDKTNGEIRNLLRAKDNERKAERILSSNERGNNHDHEQENNDEKMQLDQIEPQDANFNKRRRVHSQSPVSRKREHRSELPKESQHKDNHIKESPGKTLETLFRKTRTTPSIYWMPLTEDGMRLRDEMRERERIERIEMKEQWEKKKIEREAEERFRPNQYNGRRRSPPRREPPYHHSAAGRHYGPPLTHHQPSRNQYPSDRYGMMNKRSFRSPDRGRPMERLPQPGRTPTSRSPRRTPEQARQRKNSRSVSQSSRSSSSSRSVSPAQHSNNKQRSSKRHHSQSPVARSRSPRRLPDRRVPPPRR